MATIALNTGQQARPLYQDDPGTMVISRIVGASTTLTPGLIVYDDPTTGTMLIADAATSSTTDQPYGIVISATNRLTYQEVSILRNGVVSGFNITQNFGVLVYLDTAGTIADAANSTKTVVVGKVVGNAVRDSSGNIQKFIHFWFNPITLIA